MYSNNLENIMDILNRMCLYHEYFVRVAIYKKNCVVFLIKSMGGWMVGYYKSFARKKKERKLGSKKWRRKISDLLCE